MTLPLEPGPEPPPPEPPLPEASPEPADELSPEPMDEDVAGSAGPAAPPRPALPKARALVSAGLDLCLRANATLRGVSLSIGTLLVAAAGPVIVLLVLVGGSELGVGGAALPELGEAGAASLAVALLISGIVATLALIALVIECQILAVAILGGHAIGRPVAAHEALRRSRQVFWRVVVAQFVVQLPVNAASGAVSQMLDVTVGPTEATFVASTVVATLVATPFTYTVSGIVLGGVGAFEAIRRSWEMARYRWSTALVVAVAATLAQTLLILGIFAGLDILLRVGSVLGLGLAGDAATTALTLTIALIATAAVGSLYFTVAAIAAAPQVVAFVGLTGYGAGLDPARDDAPGATPVRWLSVPMAAGVGIAVVISALGIVAAMGGS